MCYAIPGPRCSSHAWNGLGKTKAELDAARAHLHDLARESRTMRQLPKDDPRRAEWIADYEATEFRIAELEDKYSAEVKDFNETPVGAALHSVNLAREVGLLDPRMDAKMQAAWRDVQAVFGMIAEREASKQPISAALKEERKKALERFYAVSDHATLGLNMKVAEYINRNRNNPGFEAFRDKPVMPQQLNFQKKAHAEALRRFTEVVCERTPTHGWKPEVRMRDGKTFSNLVNTSVGSASEREWRITLMGVEKDKKSARENPRSEPLDGHHEGESESKIASRRRRLDKDAATDLSGDWHGMNAPDHREEIMDVPEPDFANESELAASLAEMDKMEGLLRAF